jgi:transposase-like protein
MLSSGNSLGRSTNRSAAEKQLLIAAYRQSGESMSSFCKKQNIALSSFSTWLSKESDLGTRKEEAASNHQNYFVELEPKANDFHDTGTRLTGELPCEQVLKLQIGKAITLELSWRER